MSWRYGAVSANVWFSKKFLGLTDDSHRLSYLYLLSNKHANGVGCYHLPDIYLAADRKIDPFTAAEQLAAIEAAGLIERNEDDMLRVIGWFGQDSGAGNPSTVSSHCKLFADTRVIKRSSLRSRALSEMAWENLLRAERWDPASRPMGQLLRDMDRLIRSELKNDLKRTKAAFTSMPPPETDTLLHTVLHTVSNTLFDTLWDTVTVSEPVSGAASVSAPASGAVPVDGDTPFQDETLRDPPSPPAKGGRSGRKKVVDKATQETLDTFASRAKAGQKDAK